MTDGAPDTSPILYERRTTQGPVVRIRRIESPNPSTVCAVIEVDRRAGTPREKEGGIPPGIMAVEGDTEDAVRASLLPFAEDDSAIARLLAARGIR